MQRVGMSHWVADILVRFFNPFDLPLNVQESRKKSPTRRGLRWVRLQDLQRQSVDEHRAPVDFATGTHTDVEDALAASWCLDADHQNTRLGTSLNRVGRVVDASQMNLHLRAATNDAEAELRAARF